MSEDVLVPEIDELLPDVVADPDDREPMDVHTGDLGPEAPAQAGAATVGNLLDDALARIRRRQQDEESPLPLPGDWAALSSRLDGGLWPGLYLLQGNTGSGKTSFALQVALHAARQGAPVAYFSLDIDRMQVVARLLAQLTSVPWRDIYFGRMRIGQLAMLESKMGELVNIPLAVRDVSPMDWSYQDLETDFRNALNGLGGYRNDVPPLLILDFLQLVSAPAGGPQEDLRHRIAHAVHLGRSIARKMHAAVLMLSCAAREHYATLIGEKGDTPIGEGDAARLVGLGKESDDVEWAADGLLILARDQHGKDWVAIAKRRDEQRGWVEMPFDPAIGRFAGSAGGP